MKREKLAEGTVPTGHCGVVVQHQGGNLATLVSKFVFSSMFEIFPLKIRFLSFKEILRNQISLREIIRHSLLFTEGDDV